ncbi:MAG: hypothetical protein RR303_10275 [Bacteroidales bacterium]
MILIILPVGTIFFLNKTGKINEVAQWFMNRNLVGEMRFDSLKLDFAEFPVIEVSAKNGVLLSDTLKWPSDTLAAFRVLKAKMNPFRVFTDNLIDIPYVYLEKPQAAVLLNKLGRPGWAIWRFKKKKPTSEPGMPHKRPAIKLNIRHVEIYGNPRFYYHNFHTGMHIEADAADLFLIGRIAIDYKTIDADYFHLHDLNYRMSIPKASTLINTRSDSIYIRKHLQQDMGDYQFHVVTDNDTIFVKGNPIMLDNRFEVHGRIGIGFDYKVLELHDTRFKLDTTIVSMRGAFRKIPHRKAMDTDLQVKINTPQLNQTIYDIVPVRNRFPAQLDLKMPFHMIVDMKGVFSPAEKIFPDLFTQLKIGPGEVHYKKFPPLNNVGALLRINYLTGSQYGELFVDSLGLRLSRSLFHLTAAVKDIVQNPVATANIGFLSHIADFYSFIPALAPLNGTIRGNIELSSPLRPLFNKQLNAVQITSDIKFDSIVYVSAQTPDKIAFRKGSLQTIIPTYRKLPHAYPVNLILNIDSLSLMNNNESGLLQTLSLELNGKRSDPLSITAIEGDILLKNINANFLSSESLQIGALSSQFSAKFPSLGKLPDSLFIRSALQQILGKKDSLEMFSKNFGFYLNLDKKQHPILPSETAKQSSMKQFVNMYNFAGGMIMNRGIITTPILPLKNEVDSLEMLFNQDVVSIPTLICKSGLSSLDLDMKVTNWVNYLLNDSVLIANVNAISDSLNLTQLIPALTKGIFYLNHRKGSSVDSLAQRLTPPQLIPPKDERIRTKEKMVDIPANLNAMIKVDAKRVLYDKVIFDESHGKILITDRRAFIHNVFVDSNLGNLDVGVSYQPADTSYADISIAFLLNRLDVDKLLGIFPDLKKVIPMLQTLEGYVGCSISASAELDSTLYIRMPTLRGNAEIHGQNLSVDKAKVLPSFIGWLLFGNNEKITLDSIRVNLAMKNNILSVYPFVIDINRYRLLASGVQDVDDSFFYHLSLQKWFLPFKVGFNIYRENKKLHFGLACPRLKDMNQAARILSVNPNNFYPSRNVVDSIAEGIKQQQSVFLKFSDYYDAIRRRESEEISKKQTDDILMQLDSLRQKQIRLQK